MKLMYASVCILNHIDILYTLICCLNSEIKVCTSMYLRQSFTTVASVRAEARCKNHMRSRDSEFNRSGGAICKCF